MSRHQPVRVATIITRLEGGAGILALRGARALDRGEFHTTIVTGSGDRLLDEAAEAGLEVLVEPALRRPVDPRSDPRAFRALSALFAHRNFDVVHTHTAKAGVLGRIAARRAGVPRIVHTYHGFPFHEFQSRAQRGAYVAIERQLGRITDVTLCVGTGVAVEAVRRRLVAPQRIRTIGVAVDGGPPHAPETRDQARRALGIPADATVVGAVGRLTYQKAPEDFLTALRQLGRPDVVGVWVGGGDLAERIGRLAGRTGRPAPPAGRFAEWISRPARRAGQTAGSPSPPRVVLAGERTDIPDILPAFDVFALPSRYEGLPTAVVEAMMCGVPVVATAVNAVGDVVVPGETGLLVPPQRPDLLAAAIRYLLDRPALAAHMAATARARIDGRFSTAELRGTLTEAYTDARDHETGRRPGSGSPSAHQEWQ